MLLHDAGSARARVSRRVGPRAGLPGDRAVRDRLRARRHSSRALAVGRVVPAGGQPDAGVSLEGTLGVAPRDHRAARLHAPGLRERLRVSGGAGSRAPRDRRPPRAPRHPGRQDLGLRAAAQRAVEARARRGRRRRAEHPRIVSVVPAVDAPVGSPHAGQLVARPPFRASRSAGRARDRLVYPHVLRYRRHAENSAATASCRARRWKN